MTSATETAGFVELPGDHEKPGPWFIPPDDRSAYLTLTLTPDQLDAARRAVLDDMRQRAWIDDQRTELRRRTPGISDREVEMWTYPAMDRYAAQEYARRFDSLDVDGERLAHHVARRHAAVELTRAHSAAEQRREALRCNLCGQIRRRGSRDHLPFGTGPSARVCDPCGQVLAHRAGVILAEQVVSDSGETVADRADQWVRAHLSAFQPPADL